ncbi:MAG: hypothetical protein BroJett013_36430 [Alphaproteobacteria bacterium]|nr:MAG: hypothetical protein BroJett013_36430 [Alphaproteobacteria bacterium]
MAFDERNDVLKGALRTTGLPDFRDWGGVFRGKARFASFTHQAWFAWVEAHDGHGAWRDWRRFVSERYDL